MSESDVEFEDLENDLDSELAAIDNHDSDDETPSACETGKQTRKSSVLMVFDNLPLTPTPPPGDVGGKSLHQLAIDGDTEALSTWLTKSTINEISRQISELDEKGLTPLHYAARHSNVEVMKLLVDNGADLDKPGADDMTPLHYVSRYGKLCIPREARKLSMQSALSGPTLVKPENILEEDEDLEEIGEKSLLEMVEKLEESLETVVNYLVANGADINAQDKYGLTPLHHSVIRGNKKTLNLLLNMFGIIKEPRDAQGSTPLHLAATYNQPSIAKSLINQGDANLRALDNDHRTPLHNACMEGNVSVARIILESVEKNDQKCRVQMIQDKDDNGATPLMLGVGKGPDIINLLLGHHANPNQRNKENTFPLHTAARTGDILTTKLLVENGALIDCFNASHQTPLYIAAENNHVEIVEYLIEKGAKVNHWTVNVTTPLMIAVIEGNTKAVEVLLQKGADLQIPDKNDKSVLFHAAEQNQTEVLKALLANDKGRDLVKVADQYDNLPIHVAAEEGHLESLKILVNTGSPLRMKNEDERAPIHLASIHGRLNIIEELLIHDRNLIMMQDEDSNTPLHLACINKRYKTTALLIRYGADVNHRNTKKWTPLDCAANAGAFHCAKLLLEACAPVDPLDRTSTTPLHLAAENGHPKIVELLLSYGADVTMKDSQGKNPLERAIFHRKKSCILAILHSSKHWKKALRTSHPIRDSYGSIVPETPLRHLIKTYPDLAEVVFDKCIHKSKSSDTLEMDFEFIDDAYFHAKTEEDQAYKYCDINLQDEGETCAKFKRPYDRNAKIIMDNHPLMIMAKEEQRVAINQFRK